MGQQLCSWHITFSHLALPMKSAMKYLENFVNCESVFVCLLLLDFFFCCIIIIVIFYILFAAVWRNKVEYS